MRQLDLFAAIVDTEPVVKGQRAEHEVEVIDNKSVSPDAEIDVANDSNQHILSEDIAPPQLEVINEEIHHFPHSANISNDHFVFHQLGHEETAVAEPPVAEFILLDEHVEALPATNIRTINNNPVLFSDGKIGVKVKARPVVAKPRLKKEKIQKPPQKRGRKSFKEIDAELDLIEVPDDETLFQKQYYAISTVAGWFRVNTSLVRFWENEFDILKPKKNRKGDRLFRPEDVKNLQLIYQLLRQRKFTIEGAKEYLKANKKKADMQLQLTHTLQKFKSFLLELKANLPS
jgi:DNA-binding transcriptional MerR regulator